MVGDGSCTFKFKLVLIGQGVNDLLTIICSDGEVVNEDSDLLLDLVLLIESHPDVGFGFTRSETHFSKTIGEFVVPT